MAQSAEHVLGKDEVTGSNPVSSSIPPNTIGKFEIPPFSRISVTLQFPGLLDFFIIYAKIILSLIWLSW